MKIASSTKDNGLPLWNALLLICPLPGKLYRRLNSLCSCIHGQDHVIPEHFRDMLGKSSEHGVVERSGRQRQFLRLFDQRGHDPWVAMSLE